MASSLALKRFLSSTPLISRSLLRPVASSAPRFFNTNAVRQYDEHADDRDHYDYSTVIEHGPFRAFHNALDIWNSTEDFEILLVDMPGLGKEDVKISVNNWSIDLFDEDEGHKEHKKKPSNCYTIIIKGEGLKERRIPLLPNSFKLDQIKVEMKNGVIKIILPIIKEEEERTYVTPFNCMRPVEFNVEIEYKKLNLFLVS